MCKFMYKELCENASAARWSEEAGFTQFLTHKSTLLSILNLICWAAEEIRGQCFSCLFVLNDERQLKMKIIIHCIQGMFHHWLTNIIILMESAVTHVCIFNSVRVCFFLLPSWNFNLAAFWD